MSVLLTTHPTLDGAICRERTGLTLVPEGAKGKVMDGYGCMK
jgi:hypothetical protein